MATASGHRLEPARSGMGPRKTMIIMVTVVGCVAILWPKVFYPMMMGTGQNKNVIKDHRGAGCCGVVLDQETFANASINVAEEQQQQNLFRKRNYAPFVEIDSIRQERPPHLRPEAMHPAMRERGRAIPQAGSLHGAERPHTAPRIVEGRPGPIPGMRPPMGAGSHQATKSANSMGFIMPLYTIGIVSFFIYTIMKLIFKKSPATPYAEIKPDPAFRNEVFTTTEQYIKRPDDGTTKLAWKDHRAIVTAIQGLITAADEQLLKIDNIKKQAMNNLSKETNATSDEADSLPKEPSASTVDEASAAAGTADDTAGDETAAANGHAIKPIDATVSEAEAETPKEAEGTTEKQAKKRDRSTERGTVKVMAMEVTAQRENGKRLSRPTTPLLPMGHPEPAAAGVTEAQETRSIVLDGRLPHDSKILVADSETAVEKLDPENSDEEEDAPVILSGKMTLSLINMDFIEKDATGTVAVGEILTELHKPQQEEIATAPTEGGD